MILSATEVVLHILLFALLYSLPFLVAEGVDLLCSYTLFLKISELSQEKLFFDTALAMLEEALLLVMSVYFSSYTKPM